MRNLKDASLSVSAPLPNGAGSYTSPSIDTGIGAGIGNLGAQPGPVEWELGIPATTGVQQPDGRTITFLLISADSADLLTNPVMHAATVTTGAGGVGAAAVAYRFALPSTAKRYVGFIATGSAAGDSSGAMATLSVVF